MWTQAVIIFDDEDETALKSRFVELSAKWAEYSAFDIAQEVFRGLRDPEARANQAALIWGNQLEIKERIRKARINGGNEPEVMSDEDAAYNAALARANDESVPWTVRYKFFELAQKIKGIVKEPAEAGKNDNKRQTLPTFVFAQYSD